MLFSDRYWGIVVHGAFLKIDPQSIRSDIRERTLRLTAELSGRSSYPIQSQNIISVRSNDVLCADHS